MYLVLYLFMVHIFCSILYKKSIFSFLEVDLFLEKHMSPFGIWIWVWKKEVNLSVRKSFSWFIFKESHFTIWMNSDQKYMTNSQCKSTIYISLEQRRMAGAFEPLDQVHFDWTFWSKCNTFSKYLDYFDSKLVS